MAVARWFVLAAALEPYQHVDPDRVAHRAVVVVVPGEGDTHWNGDAPAAGPITELVVCGRSQTLEFTGRTFHVAHGPALMVGGSCVVRLKDCTIVANRTGELGAITATGNARIDITNTSIHGDLGLFAAGNAKVTVHGGSLHGEPTAISAISRSVVTVTGVSIGGDVARRDAAVVTGR